MMVVVGDIRLGLYLHPHSLSPYHPLLTYQLASWKPYYSSMGNIPYLFALLPLGHLRDEIDRGVVEGRLERRR